MEKRKVVFEFEDTKDGMKCTAMGNAFKFEDLVALHDFSLSMLHSFVELHGACFEEKYGREKKNDR